MRISQRPKFQRNILCLLAGITLSILAGLSLSLFGNRHTSRPVYSLMENFYSIDGYIGMFDRCEKLVYDYRWDSNYDEDAKKYYESAINTCLSEMRTYLRQMEQQATMDDMDVYQDCRALLNMFPHYVAYLDQFCSLMRENRRSAAIEQYYAYELLSDLIQSYASSMLRDTVQSGQIAYLNAQKTATWMWYGQVLVGLSALAVSVYLVFTLWQILQPVARLIEVSETLQQQNFDIPDVQNTTHIPEMQRLVNDFNLMKNSTKRLISTLKEHNHTLELLRQSEAQVLESQRLAEEAKLSSLRSQINPHFLFNTLNTIRRIAQLEKAPKTESLILSLAKIFRHSLRSSDGPVPLIDEISATQQYFVIQNTRFGERVSLHWTVDPGCEVENLVVPPMLLQPMVENAVRHGLEPKPEGGHIEISIRTVDDMLELVVADDGCGMSEETLSFVQRGEKPPNADHGIGLSNVYKRLHILDSRNQMLIESVKGDGTKITIYIPARYAEEE